MLKGRGMKLYVSFAAVSFAAMAWVVGAMATVDPTLSSASGKVTSYFTANLGLAIAAFIAVAGVLWILALIFRSVGLHKRRSVG